MKILFISGSTQTFNVVPFIKSQETSLKNNGVDIDHFLINDKGLLGYLKNIPKLRRQIKKMKYDVIHAHYSFSAWLALLASPFSRIVVSYMGSDVYGIVDQNGKRRLRGYREIFSSFLLQPFVSRIIAKSRNINDYIYIKKKSTIIPNGVDFEVYKPRNKISARKMLNLPLEKKLVLFLGNPDDPRKNILLVKNSLLTSDDNALLISPYPVNPQTVPFYYNACDVLVLASYLEGSPNVIKEGMASNIPIVSTDVGDVKEIISNTKGCFLCKFDPNDMGMKIRQALEFKHGTNGLEMIKHLEINCIANRIIHLYTTMINSRYDKQPQNYWPVSTP